MGTERDFFRPQLVDLSKYIFDDLKRNEATKFNLLVSRNDFCFASLRFHAKI